MVKAVRLALPWPGTDVSSWLLPGHPTTLVDCGPATDAAWTHLVAALERAGLEPGDVERVVPTHEHPDHHGNAARLQALGTRVVATPGIAGVLASWDASGDADVARLDPVFREAGFDEAAVEAVRRGLRIHAAMAEPVEVDEVVEPGAVIEGSGWSLEVLPVPGHSPHHVALVDREGGDVVTGDALLERMATNAGHLDAHQGALLACFLKSLDRFETLGPMRVLPGHGDPFEDAGATAAKHRRHVAQRLDRVRTILGEVPDASAAEVVDRLYIGRPNPFNALGEVLGYLQHLETEVEVETLREGGVVRYATLG